VHSPEHCHVPGALLQPQGQEDQGAVADCTASLTCMHHLSLPPLLATPWGSLGS
jgi:hypothetical protein